MIVQDILGEEFMVKNNMGMLSTYALLSLATQKLCAGFFVEILTLYCNTREQRTSGFSNYCKKNQQARALFQFSHI